MSADLTVDELPEWFKEHDTRLTEVETDVAEVEAGVARVEAGVARVEAVVAELLQVKAELTFLRNLLMMRPYGVKLPRNAPRDPRVLKRPRQGGHL